jgi:hypothetical protein
LALRCGRCSVGFAILIAPPGAPPEADRNAEGHTVIAEQRAALDAVETVPMAVEELLIGTVCGGSDGTSGITGYPAAGRASDMFVSDGAACIFRGDRRAHRLRADHGGASRPRSR